MGRHIWTEREVAALAVATVGAVIAAFAGIAVAARYWAGNVQQVREETAQRKAKRHPQEIDALYRRYGRPDREWSTENDTPRPPIVTRFFVYEKERVELVYAAEQVGAPPPYTWKPFLLLDPTTNQTLTAAEVLHRMSVREKGGPYVPAW